MMSNSELLNIKNRATAFIIRSNVLNGNLNLLLDIMGGLSCLYSEKVNELMSNCNIHNCPCYPMHWVLVKYHPFWSNISLFTIAYTFSHAW